MSTSVSGSTTVNGLRGNTNMISGLVSGLDTESMIEGLVDSYNQKIIGFQQSVVQQEWKQSAYRGIINDLQAFSSKYISLTNQSSNLSSESFWNSAITTVAQGDNASAVSVSGTTSVPVSVDSVLQTATASQLISSQLSNYNDMNTVEADEVSMDTENNVGLMEGSMLIGYGGSSVTISFDANDVLDTKDGTITTAEAMANLINEKLKDVYINGEAANTKIVVKADGDEVSFTDASGGGNSAWLRSVSSSLKETLGSDISTSYDTSSEATSFTVGSWDTYAEVKTTSELISGKTLSVNYNGSNVNLTIPEDEGEGSYGDYDNYADYVTASLQDQLKDQFGGAVSVENLAAESGNLQLEFTISASTGGNTLTVSSSVGKYLGLGDSGSLSNAITTSDTLDRVFGDDYFSDTVAYVSGNTVEDYGLADGDSFVLASGACSYNTTTQGYTDAEGDTVVKMQNADGEDIWVKMNSDGELRVGKEIEINGVSVGAFDAESSIQDVITAINGSDAGVNVSFSTLTNNFVINSSDTGSHTEITIGGSLGKALFGDTEAEYVYGEYTTNLEVTDDTDLSEFELTIGEVTYKASDATTAGASTPNEIIDYLNKQMAKDGIDATLSLNEDGYLALSTKLETDPENDTAPAVSMTNGDNDFSYIENVDEPRGDDNLNYTQGQNALMVVTVNGEQMLLERSSNTFEIEGLKIVANKTFNDTNEDGDLIYDPESDDLSDIDLSEVPTDGAITFEQEKNFDDIIALVAEMISDYNEMMANVKAQFTEVPLTTTSGTSYLPLTDSDRADMSDSAIEAYEEKAKTGLLYGDTNMRNLYNSMSTLFSASGSFGIALNEMGISTTYGQSTTGDLIEFDEDAFREALENNFDTVVSAFTSNTALGGSADGVMKTIYNEIEKYASVTGADKGILVNAAGSELSATSLLTNTMQTKIDTFQKLIEAWEDKLSTKVDYYTSQFTKLEILMSEANSQSSALAGLGNGY